MTIQHITSRQILDSRGWPTLETTVHIDAGISGTAAVPAGASTGSHEAQELRDRDPQHFSGRGVGQAVQNVTGPIAEALRGRDIRHLDAIDQCLIDLDGTVNKSVLGANAILSVSLAAARAKAVLEKQPLYRSLQAGYDCPEVNPDKLPEPMMNILNGGRHADTGVKIQEYVVIPHGRHTADRIERGAAVYHALGEILRQRGLSTLLGDEGGYAPVLGNDEEGLSFLDEAVRAAGLRLDTDISLGLDCAATEFYDASSQRYMFGPDAGGLSSVGLTSVIAGWQRTHHLATIEDPLAEDDWDGWTALTAALGKNAMIIGDDLFATNPARLERGIAAGAANAVLVKVNQIGTLTETMKTIALAREHGYRIVVSHRSGETTDDFIADLAVAVGATMIKAGAPARGERTSKYNRLLAIARELGV